MLQDLTDRGAVLSAMREFDLGRRAFLRKYNYRSAADFLVEHNGRFYDSKAIAGVAYGYQYPARGPLKPSQFTGGEATVKRKLESLTFRIADVYEPDGRNHYLLKLNVDGEPRLLLAKDWEGRDITIDHVQTQRDGAAISPPPPPLTPWSNVFIWANSHSDDGGIVATATIDDISPDGKRCRLRDVSR